MSVTVRAVLATDEAAWSELYAGYREFYRREADPNVVATTWQWVRDREHSMFGLVAVDSDDQLVALANLRWFARPSSATIGLYLDDLFTAAHARGTGAASALLRAAAALAETREASVVRWTTAVDNSTARSLYDSLAVATQWVTYDMQPESSSHES